MPGAPVTKQALMHTIQRKPFVLFCMNHEVSPLLGSLKLAQELKESGYRVAYAGLKRFEFFIIMQELEYLVIDDDEETHRQVIMNGDENLFNAPRIVDVFRQYMNQWLLTNRPDVVLIDSLKLFDFSMPFLRAGIPLIEFGSTLASPPNWNYPPVFSALVPSDKKGLLTRLRYLWTWVCLLVKRARVDLSPKNLRQAWEMKKQYGVDCVWTEYGLKLRLPALVACPREYNQPFTWPTTSRLYCYIGACVDPSRLTSRPLAFRIDPRKKLVYCSLGSNLGYGTDEHRARFFTAVIEAVASRPDMQLIIQTVRRADLKLLPPLPANVAASDWVPQTDILEKAFLFISHGGWGSIRESIYMGVPMILYPLGWDHPGNAARVVYHGAGVMGGSISRATAGQVAGLVDLVEADPSYHAAAKRLQKIFRDAASSGKGVEFITHFLAQAGRKNAPAAIPAPPAAASLPQQPRITT